MDPNRVQASKAGRASRALDELLLAVAHTVALAVSLADALASLLRKMGDAAANLEAAMLNSLRSMRQNATGSFVDDVLGFYHAIDWSERWLLALLFFHLCVWLVVVGTRRHNTVQMVLLVAFLAVVRAAEWINGVAGRHWELFASQQYFDKHGVFVSVMLSVNLLLAAFFILGNALRASVAMLIEVKKKEFKHEAKRKAKAAAGGGEAKKTR